MTRLFLKGFTANHQTLSAHGRAAEGPAAHLGSRGLCSALDLSEMLLGREALHRPKNQGLGLGLKDPKE